MKEIAQRYAQENVASIFLYTHEAHPGENYPHLTSIEQKLRHAHDLRVKIGVERPILVDSLDGACHRAYGSNPNMSWIISNSGIPVYKSDWTDAGSVESAIAYLIYVLKRRRNGERLAQFHVERADFRTQDHTAFYAGLERNGPKAVKAFSEAL